MRGCEAGIDVEAGVHAPILCARPLSAIPADLAIIAAMLLAVDVGNTQTHLGAFDGERLVEHWRFQTRAGATGDELAERIGGLLAPPRDRASTTSTRSASPRSCRRSAPSTSS